MEAAESWSTKSIDAAVSTTVPAVAPLTDNSDP